MFQHLWNKTQTHRSLGPFMLPIHVQRRPRSHPEGKQWVPKYPSDRSAPLGTPRSRTILRRPHNTDEWFSLLACRSSPPNKAHAQPRDPWYCRRMWPDKGSSTTCRVVQLNCHCAKYHRCLPGWYHTKQVAIMRNTGGLQSHHTSSD